MYMYKYNKDANIREGDCSESESESEFEFDCDCGVWSLDFKIRIFYSCFLNKYELYVLRVRGFFDLSGPCLI